MKATLFSQWGANKGAEFAIGSEATIGRGEDNTIRLQAKPVSNRHARIYFDAEARGYFLEDLGSLNGTELDGTRVTRRERLGRLQTIRFAEASEFMFVVHDLDPKVPEEPEDPANQGSDAPAGNKTQIDQEVPELPAALRDTDSAAAKEVVAEDSSGTKIEKMAVVLPKVLAEQHAGDQGEEREAGPPALGLAVLLPEGTRRFELHEGENLVGRSRSAAVRLSSAEFSRRHAVITLSGDRVTVRDEGSRNRTYLDNHRVDGEVEVPADGVLRFGQVEARLVARDQGPDTLDSELADADND